MNRERTPTRVFAAILKLIFCFAVYIPAVVTGSMAFGAKVGWNLFLDVFRHQE